MKQSRADLILAVYNELAARGVKLSKEDATRAVRRIFQEIGTGLIAPGDEFEIRGFGKFTMLGVCDGQKTETKVEFTRAGKRNSFKTYSENRPDGERVLRYGR